MSTKLVMDTSERVRRQHNSWPEALKREIVAAALAPGASVSVVARQYDVNTNMVFTWRKRYRQASAPAAPPQLVPVVVPLDRMHTTSSVPRPTKGIEIELPRGTRIRVGPVVKPATLRAVLDALERRKPAFAVYARVLAAANNTMPLSPPRHGAKWCRTSSLYPETPLPRSNVTNCGSNIELVLRFLGIKQGQQFTKPFQAGSRHVAGGKSLRLTRPVF